MSFPYKKAKAMVYALPNIPMKNKKLCVDMIDLAFTKDNMTKNDIISRLQEIGIKDEFIDSLAANIIKGRSNGFTQNVVLDIFKILGLSEQAEGSVLAMLEILDVDSIDTGITQYELQEDKKNDDIKVTDSFFVLD